MTRQFTDSAAREAASGRLETSFSVEAGAGTGKTKLIVDRAVNLLETGRASVSQLAVITFTDAAAAELEERIRREIAERLAKRMDQARSRPGTVETEEIVQRLVTAREDLERAAIQTIHSFAATLVRLRPVEAGVDPAFAVADAAAQGRLRDEVWEEHIVAESNRGSDMLRIVLEAGVRLDGLRELADRYADHRDVAGGGALVPAAPDPAACLRRLTSLAEDLIEGARAHCRADDDRLKEAIDRVEDLVRALGAGQEDEVRRRLLIEKPPAASTTKLGNARNWTDRAAIQGARERLTAWLEELTAFRASYGRRVAAAIDAWLRGYLAACEERKRRDGVLDFQDLLLKARDLLARPAVAAALRKLYRFILVDEFQDTDPLQVEIVALLAGEGASTEWSERRPVPGSLFIVGDPKQSIYRFRRADAGVYADARSWLERAGAGAERVEITRNFRCRPGVVDWVNAVFPRIMPDAYTPIEANRDPLQGTGVLYLLPEEDAAEPGTPGGGERIPTGDARVLEARMIARKIASGIHSAEWTIEDPVSKIHRPARYSDIALLFRAATESSLYEDALRDGGVPCRSVGGKRFFQRPEVGWFVSVLRAVENPHDEVAVVGALRSPFFGFRDDELLVARLARGRLDPLNPGAAGDDVSSALDTLGRWHGTRHEAPAGVVVRELLDRTGARALAALQPRDPGMAGAGEARRRALNLEKVADLARRHDEMGGDLRSFVDQLEQAWDEGTGEPEAPVLASEDDSVLLMTVHGAKGLEFPIVVLADPAHEPQWRVNLVVDRVRDRIEIGLNGRGKLPIRSDGFAEAEAFEKAEAERERHRLLYVATTRARDLLILPIVPGAKSAGFLKDLREARAVPDLEEDADPAILSLVRVERVNAGEHRATEEAGKTAAPAVPLKDGDDREGAMAGVAGPSGETSGSDAAVSRGRKTPLPAEGRPAGRDHDDAKAGSAAGKAGAEAGVVEAARAALRQWEPDRAALVSRGMAGAFFLAASRAGHEEAGEPDGTHRASRAALDSDLPAARAWPPGDAGEKARAFGVAVHSVLETAALAGSPDLAPLARTAAKENGIADRWTDVEAAARRALAQPALVHARGCRAFAEMPFTLVAEGTVLEGRIDLVWEEEDGSLVVADYKTDAVADEAAARERAESYRTQVALYAAALEKATGREVRETVLLFLAPGVEVRFPFDAAARSRAREALVAPAGADR